MQAMQLCVSALTAQIIVMITAVMTTDLQQYEPPFGADLWEEATLPELSSMILTTLAAMRATLDVFAEAAATFYTVDAKPWACEKVATLKMELESKFPIASDWVFRACCSAVDCNTDAGRRLRSVERVETEEETVNNMGFAVDDLDPYGSEMPTADTDDIPVHANKRTKFRKADTPRPFLGLRKINREGRNKRAQLYSATPDENTPPDHDDSIYSSQPQDNEPPPMDLDQTPAPHGLDDVAALEVAAELTAERGTAATAERGNAAPVNPTDQRPRDNHRTTSPSPKKRRTASGKKHRKKVTITTTSSPADPMPVDKIWDKLLMGMLRKLAYAADEIKRHTGGVPVPPRQTSIALTETTHLTTLLQDFIPQCGDNPGNFAAFAELAGVDPSSALANRDVVDAYAVLAFKIKTVR